MGPLIATEVERFASSASGRCDLSPSYLAVAAAAQAQRAVAELATMLHKAAHQYITTSCIPPFWQRVASLEGAHAELVDLLTQLAAVVESCRRLIKVTVDYLKTQNLADRPREKAAIKSLERHFGVSVAASLYATMPPGFPGKKACRRCAGAQRSADLFQTFKSSSIYFTASLLIVNLPLCRVAR